MSYTKVTAPVGGRIGLKQVDVGNMIQASDTNGIVVITQLQPIDVVFSVPEANVQRVMKRLAVGRPARGRRVGPRQQDEARRRHRLLTVDNQIDVSTGTIKPEGTLPQQAAYELFPNQFVNARMLLDVQKGAVGRSRRPPMQRGAQGFYVYVVGADNTVSGAGGEDRHFPGRA